jgi:hypothetical protein
VKRLSDSQVVLWALVAFAAWLFVGLPILYRPSLDHSCVQSDGVIESGHYSAPKVASAFAHQSHQQSAANEQDGTEFWPSFLGYRLKITDTLLAAFTFGLLVFTGLLWKSTEKLWKSGERSFKAKERAFIFLDGFNFEITTLADASINERDLPELLRTVDKGLHVTRFAVQPRWRNSGNTPTRNMTISVDWLSPGQPLPEDFSFRASAKSFFVAPQAVVASEIIEMPAANALIRGGVGIGPPPLMLMWGRADYEDIFGNPHFVQWCHRIFFERHDGKTLRAHSIQWGDYNRSDEDMQF